MSRKELFSDKGSMKHKLLMSLSFIAAILLLSNFIAILEYNRMRNTLTESISANVNSLNAAQELSLLADDHNMQILNAVNMGVKTIDTLSKIDIEPYFEIIATSIEEQEHSSARKLMASYDIYRQAANRYNELSARGERLEHLWYLQNIKPLYATMRYDMEAYKSAVNEDLTYNSKNFEAGFYRSIMPGTVANMLGLVLIALLAYFIISFYVNPIYKMLNHLQSYRETGKRYTYEFEGDDQLTEINSAIADIIEENAILKKRIKDLKENNQE